MRQGAHHWLFGRRLVGAGVAMLLLVQAVLVFAHAALAHRDHPHELSITRLCDGADAGAPTAPAQDRRLHSQCCMLCAAPDGLAANRASPSPALLAAPEQSSDALLWRFAVFDIRRADGWKASWSAQAPPSVS